MTPYEQGYNDTLTKLGFLKTLGKGVRKLFGLGSKSPAPSPGAVSTATWQLPQPIPGGRPAAMSEAIKRNMPRHLWPADLLK